MLTSGRNPKVVAAVRLKKRALREADRRFLVEGAQAVAEALAEDGRLESLFVEDDLDPLAVRAKQAGVDRRPRHGPGHGTADVHRHPTGRRGDRPVRRRDPRGAGPTGRGRPLARGPRSRQRGHGAPLGRCCGRRRRRVRRQLGGRVQRRRASARRPARSSTSRWCGTSRRRTRSRPSGTEGSPSSPWTCTATRTSSRRSSRPRWRSSSGTRRAASPTSRSATAERRVRVPQAGRAESLNLAAAATVCLFEWVRASRATTGPRGAGRGRRARHPVAADGHEGVRLRARQAVGRT